MTHSPGNKTTAMSRSIMLWLVSLTAVVVLLVAPTSRARAAHRSRHRHARHARKATPSPTPPTPTPKPAPAFKPVVLLAGGMGTVNAPTGETPAVLDAAQIYDPAAHKFVLTNPMTTHRDRHAAAILTDGRMLIVGGGESVLVAPWSSARPSRPPVLLS